MRELLKNVLSKTGYWTELRYQRKKMAYFRITNGEVENIGYSVVEGVGARVLVDGSWGFSSTTVLSEESLLRACEEAYRMAKKTAEWKKGEGVSVENVKFARGEYEVETDFEEVPVEAKLEEVLPVARSLAGDKIVMTSLMYRENVEEKVIVNSSGADVRLFLPKPEFAVSVVAQDGSDRGSGVAARGITGKWAKLKELGSVEEMADHAKMVALETVKAPVPEPGVFPVIMSPEVVGLLVHEAIGHTVEADFVLSGSAAAGKIGKQVASDLVTLGDTGTVPCFGFSDYYGAGTIFVDDEGVEARDVVIIENGVMKSYLYDVTNANKFATESTGNGRAYEYRHAPLVRMRNTYMAPGGHTLEEMISSVERGYLLSGVGGGQADATAEFMFNVSEVRLIEKGEIKGYCKETTISGQAFDVLKNVKMVSKDFMWGLGIGYCGKWQPAKVDGGGPYVLTQVLVGGSKK